MLEQTAPFRYAFDAADEERLRWYWEDCLARPGEEARRSAEAIERRLARIGEDLYRAAFSERKIREALKSLEGELDEARIEILTPTPGGRLEPPWELLRPSRDETPLALRCAAFVRRISAPPGAAAVPLNEGPLRVLAALCRPPARRAAGFRSVARWMAKKTLAAGERVCWEFLRPPTFGELQSRLAEARARGEPFDAVLFDGSAFFGELSDEDAADGLAWSAETIARPPSEARAEGLLAFENSLDEADPQLVDGRALGEALATGGARLLLLSNPVESPPARGEDEGGLRLNAPQGFDSVARGALAAGVEAVLSLPHNLEPPAAARHIAGSLEGLADGKSLAESVRAARRAAFEFPLRSIAYRPTPRADWAASRLYEAHPLKLRAAAVRPNGGAEDAQPAERAESGPMVEASVGPPLPISPEPGFIGRDAAVLGIDGLFRRRGVALLHGEAGCGKTSLAIEYARWREDFGFFGSIDGSILYSSLPFHASFSSLLDEFAAAWAEPLKSEGYDWVGLDSSARIEAALDLISRTPLLWIWDGVESIFNADRPWASGDQEAIRRFLESAADGQGEFLLLSRRGEDWLEDLAARMKLEGLPMRERLEIARWAIERRGGGELSPARISHEPTTQVRDRRTTASLRLPLGEQCEPDALRDVLAFGAGNPLATRLLVELALEEGVRNQAEASAFLERVYEPLAVGGPEEKALSEPLRAVLDYFFHEAASESERRVFALLYLFEGAFDLDVLEAVVEETSAAPPGAAKAAVRRAARLGALRAVAPGRYAVASSLRPALGRLFRRTRTETPNEGVSVSASLSELARQVSGGARTAARRAQAGIGLERSAAGTLRADTRPSSIEAGAEAPRGPDDAKPSAERERAFLEALARLGAEEARRVRAGGREARARLAANEANLLRCCRMAPEQGWWNGAAGAVSGLGALYDAAGRFASWRALLDELAVHCVRKQDQEALPGRGGLWRAVAEERVRLARRRGILSWAVLLQKRIVRYDRDQAGAFLDAPVDEHSGSSSSALLGLANSLNRLGAVSREEAHPEPRAEEEAIALCERAGELKRAAEWAYALAEAYAHEQAIRDLAKAERWLRRGLDLVGEDRAGKSRFLSALGDVSWERFCYARQGDRPEAELRRHLNDARSSYQRAIEHDAANDFAALALHNQQCGHVSYTLGELDRALPFYRRSIRCDLKRGNVFGAARTIFNVSIALRDAGRLVEARKYAQTAFEQLEKFEGRDGEGLLDRSRRLLASIDEAIGKLERDQRKRSRPKTEGKAPKRIRKPLPAEKGKNKGEKPGPEKVRPFPSGTLLSGTWGR